MRNLKLFSKVLSLTTGGLLVVGCVGCSKSHDSSSSYVNQTATTGVSVILEESSTATTYESTTEGVVTTVSESSVTTTVVESVTSDDNVLTENDKTVLEHFKNMGNSIKQSLDDASLLDKGKSYFIYCVDFLFYDGEIKGVKFSDLTDMAKQQLLSDIVTIDNLICSKFPNYKETISSGSASAYNKASDIIRAGSTNIKNFSREKLGEENYSKMLEINSLFWKQCGEDFEVFKDIVGEGGSFVKNYLSDWYQNKVKGE